MREREVKGRTHAPPLIGRGGVEGEGGEGGEERR